jgi:hypothetical protein
VCETSVSETGTRTLLLAMGVLAGSRAARGHTRPAKNEIINAIGTRWLVFIVQGLLQIMAAGRNAPAV